MRAGFKFEGAGRITVGGGDEMWLYVNKVLLLEVLTDPSSATIPCKTIDISAASTPGMFTCEFRPGKFTSHVLLYL